MATPLIWKERSWPTSTRIPLGNRTRVDPVQWAISTRQRQHRDSSGEKAAAVPSIVVLVLIVPIVIIFLGLFLVVVVLVIPFVLVVVRLS